jgi:2'-5' RNA ligase
MSRVQFEFDLNEGEDDMQPMSRASIDLFVGLQPTEAADSQSIEIAKDFMHRLDETEAIRPLHVTLCGIGQRRGFSTMDLAAKKEELSSVVFEPFMLAFDQIMSFDRRDEKKALVL